ncbi:pol polyprotein [Tanacetum coccineum]
MSVEDLVVRLRIKEDNKLAQKDTYTSDSTKANMVEHVGSSSRSNSKGKTKTKGRMTRRAKGSHRAANYKMPKQVNPRHENTVNDNMDMIAMVSDFVAMISEVNLVGSNNSGWWVDNGTTCHVCADKSMFHSLKEVDHGEKLYMGNSVNSDIKGDGMFKLNVMVVMNDINKMNSSAYLIKSSNMWHGRLGHVIQSDRRGEDVSLFAELYAKHEIRHEFTFPYSPQQNGIAERKNRTLKEMCMSTRSNSSNLFSMLRDPEGLIRRRNLGEPSSLFDFEEVMSIPHNNMGPPPAGPPPPNNNGPPSMVRPNGQAPRSMEELCQLSIDGRGRPITPIPIQATDFGLRHHMIQQVQNSQFHGLPSDDANRHIDKFLEITQHMKKMGFPMTPFACLFLHIP